MVDVMTLAVSILNKTNKKKYICGLPLAPVISARWQSIYRQITELRKTNNLIK